MVDAVGGVEVCIPKDVDDDEFDIHLDAGTQELTARTPSTTCVSGTSSHSPATSAG